MYNIKNKIKKILLLILFLYLPDITTGQTFVKNPFYDGEILQYRVRWAFIRLGTITLTQNINRETNDNSYILTMKAESNPVLPFIDVYFFDTSFVKGDQIGSSNFIQKNGREENNIEWTKYYYDYLNRQIKMEIEVNGRMKQCDSISYDGLYHEVLTLLLFTRMFSNSGLSFDLPTINDFKLSNTQINFTNKNEKIKIPAFSHHLKANKFEGKAEWVGKSFAGMSGDFCGWVSPDVAAVILRAEVKIFLGSVVIELESYERNGWQHADSLFEVVEK